MNRPRWMHLVGARTRALFRSKRDRSDIHDELQFHLAMHAHVNRDRGMTGDEAERRARVALGGFTQTAERAREVRPLQWLGRLGRDLRYTLRSLRRAPGFTTVAVLTIGLAIGACTAMYSVVHGVALRPLPYPSPDRLVHLFQVNKPGSRENFSDPNFLDLRAASSSFAGVAQYSQGPTALVVEGAPLRATVATVSRDFFAVFAMEPAVGRRFAEPELVEGGVPAAVISDRFWRRHFAGRRDLSGAVLRVGGTTGHVVGVMPPQFDFPLGTDVWIAREFTAASPYRTGHNSRVVARLKDGITFAAARAEATTIAARLKTQLGDATWMNDVAIVALHEEIVGRVRPVLLMLLASVALLLVVAGASLTNLLLVRAAGRQRELAVRAALGASGIGLMIPLAAEAVAISTAGGVIGLGLAYGVIKFVTTTTLFSLPRLSEVSMSWPVLAFVLAVTAATALSLGILIAWRGRRPGVVEWLKDAQRGSTGGRSVRRLRNTVVVTQLAVSLILLVGAGLLGRSLSQLLDRAPGFRTDGVLAVQMSVARPSFRYTQGKMEIDDPASLSRQADFNRRAIERLGALPGVTVAGGVNAFPLGGRYSNGRFLILRGATAEPQTLQELQQFVNDPSQIGSANFRVASAGYFAAMGIPLVRGRLFESSDTAEAPHVAVISESLARTRWPDSDPIGVRIQFGGMDGDMTPFTIVGIVGNIRERGLDTEPQPMFYADFRQRPLDTFDFSVVLHTSVEPVTLIPAARRVLAEMAPDMPPTFRTVREALDGTTASRRLTLALTSFFAGAAMLLALLGVYGVLSYQVEQRRQEFGVRMALGARPADVRRLVMREAGWLVVIGLGLGVSAALAVSRVLEGVLFGISSTDVATYIGVIAALGLAALAAAQLPAIRATRVDPVKALFEG